MDSSVVGKKVKFFIIVICGFMLCAAQVINAVTKANAEEAAKKKDIRNEKTINKLIDDGARERQTLLALNTDLNTKVNEMSKTNKAFVDWLRLQGIPVPDRFVFDENKRPESESENKKRKEKEAKEREAKKALNRKDGGGTTNSGPDKPGGSGKKDDPKGGGSGPGKDHGGKDKPGKNKDKSGKKDKDKKK